MAEQVDREIIADLYLSRQGMDFLVELVEGYGPRFGGSEEERAAAEFIKDRFEAMGLERTSLEEFTCPGWVRKETSLAAVSPEEKAFDCIALPFCPPGEVEAPLVYLGDGHPQAYEDNRDRLKGAVAMVTTATPRFYHRSMHRGEKLGRALEAGAIGFIWMRGEPGGLPETGSARLGFPCEVPAISVSYETGHDILRLGRKGDVKVKISSDNQILDVTSLNPVGEIVGRTRPDEIIVVGAHYDGHDISQSAADDGAGTAVVVEAARALSRHKDRLDRTVRFVGFAQEEMGLMGAEHHVTAHAGENMVFMLNLDGAGRGSDGSFVLQGWPEAVSTFKDMFRDMNEEEVAVGDRIGIYSDMYPFAARGIPAATMTSAQPATSGAPRGYGHTFWDSLDKVSIKPIQIDASRVARLIYRLATVDEVPLRKKDPGEIGEILREVGYEDVLRYEKRPLPGE